MLATEICNQGNITEGLCNSVVGSINTQEGIVVYTDFGYLIEGWSAYLFITVFGVVTGVAILIGVLKRQWWTLGTLMAGGAVETIGWGGRVMAYKGAFWNENLGGFYMWDDQSFIIQTVCLIIAPVFFSAANYILLGKLINATGGHYCIATAKSFSIIFMIGDFICLVIQAAGGALAATSDNPDDSDKGALIMTGGVVLQLAVTAAFTVLLVDFVRRYRAEKPVIKQRHFLPNWRFLARSNSAPIINNNNDMSMNSLNSSGQVTPQKPEQRSEEGVAGPSGTTSQGTRGYISSFSSVRDSEISPRGVGIMIGLLVSTTLLIVVRSLYRSVELTDGWSGPIATNQALFLGLDAFLMALLMVIYTPFHPAFFLPRLKL